MGGGAVLPLQCGGNAESGQKLREAEIGGEAASGVVPGEEELFGWWERYRLRQRSGRGVFSPAGAAGDLATPFLPPLGDDLVG